VIEGAKTVQALDLATTMIDTEDTYFPTKYLLISGEEMYCRLLRVIRPHLWSSGQSSWLQIQRSGFDSRHYQIFLEVVGLERGPHIEYNGGTT
jgi:hypothetical protein